MNPVQKTSLVFKIKKPIIWFLFINFMFSALNLLKFKQIATLRRKN